MKQLERRLKLPTVIAITVSAMLGGVFILPGLAAAKTGPGVWLAFAAAGLCILPAALSKSELATAMPTSGGTYVFLERAFGPFVGTVSGLGLWLSLLLKAAFALVGFSAYLVVIGVNINIKAAALALLGGIALLNIRGVKRVGQLQVIATVVAVVGLVVLSTGGLTLSYDASQLSPMFTKGTAGFLAAVAFLFVSFSGVTKVAAIGEEVVDPDRTLPRGILISLGAVTVIYAAVSLVMAATIPPDVFVGDKAPVFSLASSLGLPTIVGIAAAGLGILAMVAMANAGLLASSRFPFAMSRDRLLPPQLSGLSRYLTPTTAITATVVVMATAIVLFDIEKLAKLASSFKIMAFLAVNVTVIVMRETRTRWYQPGFRSPLYPWIQLAGITACVVLLIAMGIEALLAGLAIFVPGILLYLFYGRRRAERRGIVGLRRLRRDLLRGRDDEPYIAPLSGEAAVAVALFGEERSPERLVELGHALGNGGLVEVVHLTEVPEQTAIDMVEDHPAIESERRRLRELSRDEGIALQFESLATRDIFETVHQITSRMHCSWLVMEWGGRSAEHLTAYNPLGWLTDHLSANLATLHDAGVRDFRRILVLVEPGPHDALVLGTADQLASTHGSEITFARFVPETTSATDVQAAADYLDQVRGLSVGRADSLLMRGTDEAAAIAEASPAYDLLVTAGRPQATFFKSVFKTASDRLVDSAACSVLKLLTPRHQTHETIERYRTTTPQLERTFMDFVNPDCIEAGIEPMKKDALFAHFADRLAAGLGSGVTSDAVLAGLKERERTQNTAVGQGLAIPHATLSEVGRTHVGIFTTAGPVDYLAPDGQGVDVFLVTLGTPGDRQTHLVLLSTISRMVLQTGLLERLREAESAEPILAAVREAAAEVAEAG